MMKRRIAAILALFAGGLLLAARTGAMSGSAAGARFEAIAVFADSGSASLAAWQLDFSATRGAVRIAGIEGGEHPVFAVPPYYDPAAIRNERVIIAAFTTAAAENLPRGRTRIATIHVEVSGDVEPQYQALLAVAAGPAGAPIPVTVTLQRGEQR